MSVETLVWFFAVCGPKFTKSSARVQERLQFAMPFSVWWRIHCQNLVTIDRASLEMGRLGAEKRKETSKSRRRRKPPPGAHLQRVTWRHLSRDHSIHHKNAISCRCSIVTEHPDCLVCEIFKHVNEHAQSHTPTNTTYRNTPGGGNNKKSTTALKENSLRRDIAHTRL